jgi:hypothetical protein
MHSCGDAYGGLSSLQHLCYGGILGAEPETRGRERRNLVLLRHLGESARYLRVPTKKKGCAYPCEGLAERLGPIEFAGRSLNISRPGVLFPIPNEAAARTC